jgi:hypothetical protein
LRPSAGASIVRGVHTHFGSATNLLATFLGVLIVGTFWRLVWMHALASRNRHLQGLARAGLTQF